MTSKKEESLVITNYCNTDKQPPLKCSKNRVEVLVLLIDKQKSKVALPSQGVAIKNVVILRSVMFTNIKEAESLKRKKMGKMQIWHF